MYVAEVAHYRCHCWIEFARQLNGDTQLALTRPTGRTVYQRHLVDATETLGSISTYELYTLKALNPRKKNKKIKKERASLSALGRGLASRTALKEKSTL